MLTAAKYRDYTTVAQILIAGSSPNGGSPLRADGKWGKFTQASYESLSTAARGSVDAVLASLGTSANELRNFRLAEAVSSSMIDRTDIVSVIKSAAAKAGVDGDMMVGFAKIESQLNPRAANGQSRGLMQVQPRTWEYIAKFEPSLGSYENVWDPYLNALAGAVYAKMNIRAIRGYKGWESAPINAAHLYMAHQQGVAGFMELWNASQGRVTTSYVTMEKMEKNPPQDRKGVTYNKALFYERWMAVLMRKLA